MARWIPMRIGELLVEQRKLSAKDLDRALATRPGDTRLCSFLIAQGLIEFDDGARALGEQKRVPCALVKHLSGRDPALAKLIAAELGRGSCALPLGRTSKGAVIVCVRDPSPAVYAALAQAIPGDVMMVVAPADRLERLVAEAYGKAPTGELDIELDFAGAIRPTRRPLTTPPQPLPRAPTPPPLPPLPELDVLDPDSVRLALTDLDDVRVARDPTQSGQLLKATTLPPPVHAPPPATTTPSPAPRQSSIDQMAADLERAPSREAATDLVLSYIATRWRCGLVLAIREKVAIGYRGHGVTAPELVTVSLGSPSTVQRAFQTRDISVETPSGVGQAALLHALNGAHTPAAAPVIVGGQPVAILAVGDPIASSARHDSELKHLAEVLGAAYQRTRAR